MVASAGKQKVAALSPEKGKGKGKLLIASTLLPSDSSSDEEGLATPLVSPFVEPRN